MGAILIFLPGWDEIVRLKEKLESSAAFGGSRWVVQGGWEVREVWKRLAPSDLHPRRPRQLAHPCPPTHARPPMPAAPLHSPGTSCCRCTRWWRPQSSAACLCAPPRGCARSSWPPTLLKRPLPSMTWCASSTRVGGRVGGWVHVSVHASVPARAGGRRVRATPPPAPPPLAAPPGRLKEKSYDPYTNVSTLQVGGWLGAPCPPHAPPTRTHPALPTHPPPPRAPGSARPPSGSGAGERVAASPASAFICTRARAGECVGGV